MYKCCYNYNTYLSLIQLLKGDKVMKIVIVIFPRFLSKDNSGTYKEVYTF